ncbi:MAG: FAD-dependent oxidoreductase [Gammaproteobacteria bacterium]|nr:FAD-dependent oxidoreductase [Gammaproteobacteria bacterium]
MTQTTSAPALAPGIDGFSYADLYQPAKLAGLLTRFDRELETGAPELWARFAAYRANRGEGMTPEDISAVLVDTAPYVGEFVGRLFGVTTQHAGQVAAITGEFATIFKFRTDVVGTFDKRFKGQDAASWDRAALTSAKDAIVKALGEGRGDAERDVAAAGLALDALAKAEAPDAAALRTKLAGSAALAEALAIADHKSCVAAVNEALLRWCRLAATEASFAPETHRWVLFKVPAKTDWDDLVEHQMVDRGTHKAWVGPEHERRRRVGFSLTDPRMDRRHALYEIDHCIFCHDRDADSCAKGMRNKKEGGYKVNALGVTVTGCPLGEKISEMHLVKRNGDNIGALALIIIDNPMCPGTGHRICNDCMKGCIYQKTEPVNIPQIETNVLTDVLFMPWGFEIYSFLTRWNPLNVARPHALPHNGKKVLVVGLGPAGYTLAHYLLNEGFAVVGVDALKLEPLPQALLGVGGAPQPIRDFRALYEDLDKRTNLGFGGVAEYGITARWDKNFLKVIYLTLLRRETFRCFGGVRFGGTITVDDAWKFGFDHIAMATGAGKPSIIGLKNNLLRGIRKASDFLMGLQLTGAAKDSSLANLQVRLPAGIIGGGLTAIDTTTEVLAYYPKQVTKTLTRYEKLVALHGEEKVRARFDKEELGILDEFLAHGRAIRAERERAEQAGETPAYAPLVKSWGGSTMFYRKGVADSPAYRQNHEEIKEALAESIDIAPGMNPIEAIADEFGALAAVRFEKVEDGKKSEVVIPMRSLFIAAGTSPNIIYEQEHPGTFNLAGKFFKNFDAIPDGTEIKFEPITVEGGPKIAPPAPFTSYHADGRHITFYGDNHPVYAGNVVKAMASAKDGYPHVVNLFAKELAKLDPAGQGARDAALGDFFGALEAAFTATVVNVERLTPTIIDVIVKAPHAAKHFEPGQFYRVQNLENLAPTVKGTTLASEGIALTGAWVDKEQGIVSLIALEMGTSTRLCAGWKPGDRLVVMGVTGAPTHIPQNETVLLAGGGLGNAVLFSIGKALRAAGNKVIYFAGYKYPRDVFKVEDIEAAADVVVWSVDPGPDVTPIKPRRPQDLTFVGNIVQSMVAYASGQLGTTTISLADASEMIVIGSDGMMAAVKAARFGVLAPHLKPDHRAIGSINSPMQCMMKGVCAQCMCKHVDPKTGAETFVYSCYNQDQPLDLVDFPHLRGRLRQNSVQEKIGNMWFDYVMDAKAG